MSDDFEMLPVRQREKLLLTILKWRDKISACDKANDDVAAVLCEIAVKDLEDILFASDFCRLRENLAGLVRIERTLVKDGLWDSQRWGDDSAVVISHIEEHLRADLEMYGPLRVADDICEMHGVDPDSPIARHSRLSLRAPALLS